MNGQHLEKIDILRIGSLLRRLSVPNQIISVPLVLPWRHCTDILRKHVCHVGHRTSHHFNQMKYHLNQEKQMYQDTF